MNTPPNSETPRADILTSAIERVTHKLKMVDIDDWPEATFEKDIQALLVEASKVRQLEKELNEAQLALVNRNSWAREVQQAAKDLESRLEARERANNEMREALLKIKPDKDCPWCSKADEPCHYCYTMAGLQGQVAHALSSTSGQSYIPREVAQELRTQLEQCQRDRRTLSIALQGMSELCDNYFDESGLVCARDREIWRMHLEALQLAQSYGLEKRSK